MDFEKNVPCARMREQEDSGGFSTRQPAISVLKWEESGLVLPKNPLFGKNF